MASHSHSQPSVPPPPPVKSEHHETEKFADIRDTICVARKKKRRKTEPNKLVAQLQDSRGDIAAMENSEQKIISETPTQGKIPSFFFDDTIHWFGNVYESTKLKEVFRLRDNNLF